MPKATANIAEKLVRKEYPRSLFRSRRVEKTSIYFQKVFFMKDVVILSGARNTTLKPQKAEESLSRYGAVYPISRKMSCNAYYPIFQTLLYQADQAFRLVNPQPQESAEPSALQLR